MLPDCYYMRHMISTNHFYSWHKVMQDTARIAYSIVESLEVFLITFGRFMEAGHASAHCKSPIELDDQSGW